MSFTLMQAQFKLEDIIRDKGTVEDIFKLVEQTSGQVVGASPSDTFILQAGHLTDGAHTSSATGAIVLPNVHDIGDSPVGALVASPKFQNALKDAIARQLGAFNYEESTPQQKSVILEKFSLHMDGLDATGNRVASPYSIWDVTSDSFVRDNNGNWRIMAGGDVRNSSILAYTELPRLLLKSGDFEIDGVSRSALVGSLEAQKSQVIANAVAQTFLSGAKDGQPGGFMEMNPEKVAALLADESTLVDGKTYKARFLDFTSTLSPEVSARYLAGVETARLGMADLSKRLPVRVMARFGIVFGALGFLAAGQASAKAASEGNNDLAVQIMRDYAVEFAASEVASAIAGSIAAIGIGVAVAVGAIISAPVAGALVLGATLLGGFFGGEAVHDYLDYLNDRDANGRADVLDKLKTLIFGAEWTTTSTPPPDLLARALALGASFTRLALDQSYSREDIVANAKRGDRIGDAWRYALRELNGFVVEGLNYETLNIDKSIDLFKPEDESGTMTEEYLKDRAAMLTWLIRYDRGALDDNDSPHDGPKPYNHDWDTSRVEGNWDFVDLNRMLPGGRDPLTLAIDGVGITLHDHQVVFGSARAETIKGEGDSDRLYGGGGNDTIYGAGERDYIEGNGGKDVLNGDAGRDTLRGGAGDDMLNGGEDQDLLYGEDGTDTLMGGDGDDYVSGGIGNDLLEGEGGNDFLNGGAGSDTIRGGSGNDYLFDQGGSETNTLRGDGGNDVLEIKGGTGIALLDGGDGNDILIGGEGGNSLNGGAGNDSIRGGADLDIINGGDGADVVEAGAGNDEITGGKGADYLKGGAGSDTYNYAGRDFGVDLIEDASGADKIFADGATLGTASYDANKRAWVAANGMEIRKYVVGGSTTLSLSYAGDKLNTIYLRDWSAGRYGISLTGEPSERQRPQLSLTGPFSIALNNFVDVRTDDMSADALDGGLGNDVLFGTGASSMLLGGTGNDLLSGGRGDDWLEGGGDNDVIFTGEGKDYADGGSGNDLLFGGLDFLVARTKEGKLYLQSDPSTAGDWLLTGSIATNTAFNYVVGQQAYEVAHPELAVFDIKFETERDTAEGYDGRFWWQNSESGDASWEPSLKLTIQLGDVSLGDNKYLHRNDFLDTAPATIGQPLTLEVLMRQGGRMLLPGSGIAGVSLHGGAGDDVVYGTNNHDKLTGDGDNDLLIGYDGDDELDGGDGEDELSGGAGRDSLQGGAGKDTLVGGLGADVLDGGEGDDKLIGDAIGLSSTREAPPGLDRAQMGGDYLVGGAGNDSLWGNYGDDYLFGGNNDDAVSGDEGDDHLFGEDGVDVLWGGDGDDYADGGAEKDQLFGGRGNDMLLGGSGDDALRGEEDDDILDGGLDNDILIGGGGADILRGGEGKDTLYGDNGETADGDDILEGGAGDDELSGGGGNDIYVFSKGDGQDIVHDDAANGTRNLLTFKFDSKEIHSLKREDADLVIRYGVNDQVRVVDFYAKHAFSFGDSGSSGVESPGDVPGSVAEIAFEDGTIWDRDDILAMAPPPPDEELPSDPFAAMSSLYFINALLSRESVKAAGKQVLSYSFGTVAKPDVTGGYAFTNEQKQAVRTALSRFSAVLDLRFVELWDNADADLSFHLDDLTSAGLGAAAGYATPATGEIHLNSSLYSENRPDPFGNAAPERSLNVGASGFKTLLHEIGHALGLKHPFEAPVLPNAENNTANTVMSYTSADAPVTDLAAFDIAALQYLFGMAPGLKAGDDVHGFAERWIQDTDGHDLFDASAETGAVKIDLTPGSWIHRGQKSTSILADGQAYINFGSVIEDASGGAGDDTLIGNSADNLLRGNAGNDVLQGGSGNDTLIGGEGSDTYAWGAGGEKVTIADGGVSGGDIDTLRVVGGLKGQDILLAQVGDDLAITTSDGANLLLVRGHFVGDAIERITFDDGTEWDAAAIEAHLSRTASEGADFLPGTSADDLVDGLGGNDVLGGLDGADTLFGGAGNDTLSGDDGNDALWGGDGIDRLSGGAGDDLLSDGEVMDGGSGSDTYVWSSVSSLSVLRDDAGAEDIDTLRFASGIRPSDLVLRQRGADLTLWVKGTDGGLVVVNQFSAAGSGVERFAFEDGTVWDRSAIYPRLWETQQGSSGGDVLSLGPFDDNFSAGAGDDLVDGRDGDDHLLGEDGNDSLAGGAGQDVLDGGEGRDLLTGGDGNDQLYGGGGNDTLRGDAGNDVLDGGAGANELYGGDGDDSFDSSTAGASDRHYGGEGRDSYNVYYGSGYGIQAVSTDDSTISDDRYVAVGGWSVNPYVTQTWTINDAGGADDRLNFGGSFITAAATVVRTSGTSLVVTGMNLKIVINNAVNADGSKGAGAIERITLGDGTAYDFNRLVALSQTATSGNDSITGFSGNDVLDGGAGRDTLDGGAGNDVLRGGADFDVLSGGLGDDTLEAGVGGGSLNGGAGNDTFIVRTGDGAVDIADDLNDSGFDTLLLGAAPGALTVSLEAVSQDSDEDVVVIRWRDGSASVRFGLNATSTSVSTVIERVRFSDGSELDLAALAAAQLTAPTSASDLLRGTGAGELLQGLSGNDTLYGRGGPDTLDGGAGDDLLVGGNGDDVLIGGVGNDTFNGGAGHNVIELSNDSGQDSARVEIDASNTLRFGADVDAASVHARWSPALRDYRNAYESQGGLIAALRWSGVLNLTYGTNGSSLAVDAANHLWTPQEAVFDQGRFGIDGVQFADGTTRSLASLVAEANTVTAGGDLLLDALEGNQLSAGVGNDTLYGFGGANQLSGEEGDDFIFGGDDDDVLLSGGSGNDTIVGGLGSDLLVGGEGNDRLAAGTDWSVAGLPWNSRLPDGEHASDRDTLIGGAGNDFLFAGDRDVVFQFSKGSGQDYVSAGQTRGYTSTLQFDSTVNAADVQFSRGIGRGLLVSMKNSGDIITIADFFETEDKGTTPTLNYANTRFEFADGSVVLAGQIPSLMVQIHTLENDLFLGTDGDDVLMAGGKPGDRLLGGRGNDTLTGPGVLVGGEGSDVYRFDFVRHPLTVPNALPADVIIEEDFGEIGNTLVVGAGVDPDDIIVLSGRWEGYRSAKDGYRLESRVTGASVHLFGPIGVQFANGVVWGEAELQAKSTERYGTGGNDTLEGDSYDNRMSGLAGNDSMLGFDGNDTLDGGLGADAMKGGTGDDLYVVDNIGDVVTESANQGNDKVRSSIAYTLGNNVEQLELTGSSDINGTGNTLANVLIGNAGANVLTGGTGNDTMSGGLGNDTYVVDATGDFVIENANEGIDLVQSGANWTLGANVEHLTLTGSNAINGTGNGLDNVLTGNGNANKLDGAAGNDSLVGAAGADSLTGGTGNDTLDGGAGNDTMLGGAGDDFYIVDATTDAITENANEGTDTVLTSVTLTLLAANVENVMLATGTTALSATGNASNNVMTGNAGANTLTGAAGNDTLQGGLGNDSLVGGAGADVYLYNKGDGTDTIQDSDSTSGVLDQLNFGASITRSGTTFKKVSNNLEITFTGTTTDKVVVKDWYLGAANQIERVVYADGTVMTNAQVNTAAGQAAGAKTAMVKTRADRELVETYQDWLIHTGTDSTGFDQTVTRQADALIEAMASFSGSSSMAVNAALPSYFRDESNVIAASTR